MSFTVASQLFAHNDLRYFFHRAHSEKKAFEKGNAEDVMQAHSAARLLSEAKARPTRPNPGGDVVVSRFRLPVTRWMSYF